MSPGTRRDEAGSAIVEVTWLGLLFLIPLVYVVVSVFTVQRNGYGATEAARSAARAFILSPDVATARARAHAAAELAMRDQGIDLAADELDIRCLPEPTSCLQPGSSVEVRLDLTVRLPLAPTLGQRPVASIAVHASHTEPYGTYREAAP